MWALHIVVVRGGTGWPSALLFGFAACLSGGLFAWLAGESRNEAALTLDLLLASAGALLGQLAAAGAGSDPLATIFGVHLFASVFGALMLLSLAHDAAALEWLQSRLPLPICSRGGLCCTFLGLAPWPPGVEPRATYGAGLRIGETERALYYEVPAGPLRGTRSLLLSAATTVIYADGALLVCAAGITPPLLRLGSVVERDPAARPNQPQDFAATRSRGS